MYNRIPFIVADPVSGRVHANTTPVEIAYIERPTPDYIPMVVNTDRPTWIDDAETVAVIANKFKAIKMNEFDGYHVNDCGVVVSERGDDYNHAGIIHGMIVDLDGDNGSLNRVQLVNTENAGFRYVTNQNGNMTDMGPVHNVCIVGNYERPEGLYVPLYNLNAIDDAITILDAYYNSNILENTKDVKMMNHPNK